MSDILKIKQEVEQLALIQLGCIIKDIIPSKISSEGYVPPSLQDAANILDQYLNVRLQAGDLITDFRDRAMVSYLDTFKSTTISSHDDAFDYAMKGMI